MPSNILRFLTHRRKSFTRFDKLYRAAHFSKEKIEQANAIRQHFDFEYYIKENDDVVAQGADPVIHYFRFGEKEGRKPTRDFDPFFYKARNPEITQSVNLFYHYITEGKKLDFKAISNEDYFSEDLENNDGVTPSRRPKNDNDFAITVPFKTIPNGSPYDRVAVMIHAFYPELMGEMLSYIDNIPCFADLFISTDTADKVLMLEQFTSSYKNGVVNIHLTPNVGRDIAPFISLLPLISEKYDVVIHTHTKKSPHGGSPLEKWREYLLGNLLGSKDIVLSIFQILSETTSGVVFPQHLFALRGILNWGYDFETASKLLRRVGVVIDKDMVLEFPSGSMFWAKTKALSGLASLNLTPDDFSAEAGQVDGTMAHAIERTLLMFAEVQGYQWAKVLKRETDYPHRECLIPIDEAGALERAMPRVYRPLIQRPVSGAQATERSIPDARLVLFHPSANPRPRINLFVPTVNPGQVFGGVSTALRLFNEMKDRWSEQADFRIIVTDALVERESLSSYKGADLETISPDDVGHPFVIVDANKRESDRLNVRKRDTFIATAWWTARFSMDALNFQSKFFEVAARFIYIVQDYEPNFYGWGSRWILAESTYKYGDRAVAIINSEELYRFYQMSDYSFKESFCLPYRINDNLSKMLAPRTREKIILFYGRPSVARNMFELIIDGVTLWQRRNPVEAVTWRIVSAGEDYPPARAAPVQNLTIVGKMSLDAYALWLSKASIGISLMASPHPSYPPLEMAEAGLMTITNTFGSRDLSSRFENITSIATIDGETIADAIEACVGRFQDGTYPRDTGRSAPKRIDHSGIEMYDVTKIAPYLEGLNKR